MRLFGFEIELLLLLQVLATVAIVGAFSLFSSLQEPAAERRSQCIMILLLDFLLEHHPSINSLAAVSEAKNADTLNKGFTIAKLKQRFEAFKESGVLTEHHIEVTILEHLLVIVFAPVATVAIIWIMLAEAAEYRFYRIVHTEVRRNYMSKGVLLMAGNVGFLFLGGSLVVAGYNRVGVVLMIAGGVGLLASIAWLLLLVRWQQSWKDYWQQRLLEVMAVGAHSKDHDLFNRSMMLWSDVWRQPVVPIPGGLGLYVAIFSGVQAVLLWLSRYLGF